MMVDGSRSGTSLPEKVIEIHRALATAKIPHAIGGAIALAYYAEPRATVDVDVNVFVRVGGWPQVRDALAPLGVDVRVDEEALRRDGQVRLWWDRSPVDLFFSYDPFHDDMEGATRRVPFADDRLPILGPEHLMVCKAIFDRPKDWLDIEAMLVVTDPLDVGKVESWLKRMVGADDERLAKLDEIIERLEIEDR
ncbi:MAG: hypothetical protein JST53_13495 [Actinobacteria bacterium]|nr:hypothetical protein [Actinomycetota bacterium]